MVIINKERNKCCQHARTHEGIKAKAGGRRQASVRLAEFSSGSSGTAGSGGGGWSSSQMAASAGCVDKTLMKQRPRRAAGMLFLLHKQGQNVQGGAAAAAANAQRVKTEGRASVSLCCESHLSASAAAEARRVPCIMGGK